MSPLRALCAIAVPVVLFVGCSSDGDSTSEPAGTDPASTATSVDVGSTVDPDATGTEAFCAAGADLRANVESLADVDVLTGGLSGIEDTLASIGDNLAAMRDSGADVATAEIEQLQAAVTDRLPPRSASSARRAARCCRPTPPRASDDLTTAARADRRGPSRRSPPSEWSPPAGRADNRTPVTGRPVTG
jgi:hypothetical protein